MWRPSRFSKAFAWSQVYVTGILTWPNAAFTFLAFPALAYKFGEGPSTNELLCSVHVLQHVSPAYCTTSSYSEHRRLQCRCYVSLRGSAAATLA